MYNIAIEEMQTCIEKEEANSDVLPTKPSFARRGKIGENNSVDQQQNQTSRTSGLVRRVSARMKAPKRLLSVLTYVEEAQPQQFYAIKIEAIKDL
uniref:Uncharacterized protein n=1 Tax=Glossina palpalis gambiensis TaxID=67801 RepID=A0A1B0BZD3_9MUSC